MGDSMGVVPRAGHVQQLRIVQGVDQIVPVDVHAWPPARSGNLLHAIFTLHTKIESGELVRRREANGGGAGITIEQRDGQTAGLTIGPT